MFVRQVKRKCGVRGCKSTDCFAISRTREVGNTVIICKSCLGKALGAIDEIDPKTKSNIPAVDNTSVPSLFFNAKALGTDAAETKIDDVPPVTDNGQGETTPPPTTENGKEPDNGSDVPPVDGVTTPPADNGDKEPEQSDDVTPPVDDVPPATDAEDNTEGTNPPEDVTEFKCPICGKTFDSEKGLKTHLRYCKPQTDKE